MPEANAGVKQRNNRSLGAGTFLVVMLVVVVAVFIGVTMLPHDRYIRFQSLRGTLHARAEWVYDRIHNDPTPVDILIVGPSRTVSDIDPLQLQDNLQKNTGMAVHVAHFGYAEPGVNLPYLMVRETFETKKPKIVIVGVIDQQNRNGHPAFKDLADTKDIIHAPILLNKDYLSDLAFLPMRQLRLAADSVLAPHLDFRHVFDPALYAGSEIDVEARYPVHQTTQKSFEQLKASAAEAERKRTRPYLPSSMSEIEFAAQRYYLERIAAIADQHGAKLIFVYLPGFDDLSAPTEMDYYKSLGSVLLGPSDIRTDPSDFFDVDHLNAMGKTQFTTWLALNLEKNVTAWRTK